MLGYLIKRLLLIIPTMFGIMLFTFVICQFVPGGPIEQMLAKVQGNDVSATERIGGGGGDGMGGGTPSGIGGEGSNYRGAKGLDPKFIKELEQQFGFDKPPRERFMHMMGNYLRGDFGRSYFKDRPVIDLIKEKLPVSIRLGLIMLFLTYLIAIPLGIKKAVRDGTPFDAWTSSVLVVGYAIPGFIFAVVLIVFFAGSSFLQIFPLRGLKSDYYNELSLLGKIANQAWHLVLPIFALAVGAFTTLAFLTKNSFLDEIKKQYVTTARAKGLSENRVLYGHVFRNAMLIIIAGMPAAFISAFLTGSLLIETIFSLDGLGLLGFESLIGRDYPIVYGTLFIFSLVGLVVHIVTDFVYTLVDPRIDFNSREV